ncbi:MAG TPA: zf-HC2 domain-containing protein [Candidatus Competibacteraceae bacterium]|nr:zf-HC2 domain-containing protein [Candidatus Competibacteraceae bacterium]
MSTTPDSSLPLDPHTTIVALLPWYVNDTLSPVERAAVDQHLGECPACRDELAHCRTLADAVQDPAPTWQPAPGAFERLMADIEHLEAVPAPRPAPKPHRAMPFWHRIRDWLGATPSPVRWTLALEGMAVAALLLIVILPGARLTADYETLSSGSAQPATAGPRLRIVFVERATARDMQRLLLAIEGSIVAGPGALGVYTVALPAGARASDALGSLRNDPAVRLAEAAQEVRP